MTESSGSGKVRIFGNFGENFSLGENGPKRAIAVLRALVSGRSGSDCHVKKNLAVVGNFSARVRSGSANLGGGCEKSAAENTKIREFGRNFLESQAVWSSVQTAV